MNAQPEIASAARNAAVWLGAVPVPRWANSSENSCCRKKKKQQQRDAERADDFRIDPQGDEELKDRDVDQIEDGADQQKHRSPYHEGDSSFHLLTRKKSPARPRRCRRSW